MYTGCSEFPGYEGFAKTDFSDKPAFRAIAASWSGT